jgi:hypothetical protein
MIWHIDNTVGDTPKISCTMNEPQAEELHQIYIYNTEEVI